MEEDENAVAEGMIPRERRLVIGLDFGTTFTGVAYATPYGTECSLTEIDVIKDWGPQMDNHSKVPSVISYSKPTAAREQQWGSSLSPDAVAMVHTKLELDTDTVLDELDLTIQSLDGMKNLNFQLMRLSDGLNELPEYSHKSPEEIVTEYLTKVFEHLERIVQRFTRALRDRIATDIVVTVPTKWSYRAINATYRALTTAGFSQKSFPMLQEVIFVTEPEAAAIYTARYYKDIEAEEFLRETKPCAPTRTSHKCGSIFINLEFKQWLKKLLGEHHYCRLDPNIEASKIASLATEGKAMRDLMKRFDDYKKAFIMGSTDDIHLDLPPPLANETIPDAVDEGEITITSGEMESFFDECIGHIVKLIKGHIEQIEEYGGSKPENVFLVGGFGESKYLQGQIERSLQHRDINLRKPDTSWTAVVQGAVICGIEKLRTPHLVRASSCKHSYAISLTMLFSDTYHPQKDIVMDRGLAFAEGQLIWLLDKGDLILSTAPREVIRDFRFTFTKTGSGTKSFPIYRYSGDEGRRPTRYKNAKTILMEACNLTIDLSKIPEKQCDVERSWVKRSELVEYCTTITLQLILSARGLKASIWWRNIQLSGQENVMY